MNKELLKELEEKFKQMKKEFGIKSELQDIDEIFFIKDRISQDKFVSENISRQICSKMVETYMGWTNYLHSLIMPNPQNILNIGESKIFNQEEKNEIKNMMKKAMEFSSRNSWIVLTKNKEEEVKFIDEVMDNWKNDFSINLIKILKKVKEEWTK
jgi:hypothetical protein